MTNLNSNSDLSPALSIAAVEREVGIGKDTLRVWERRYGFPAPTRDANDERLYPPEQVKKLRLIKRLMDQGWRPGRLFAAGIDELTTLDGARGTPPVIDAEIESLLSMVRVAHGEALRSALMQAMMKKGLQRFVLDIAAPLNVAIGEAWSRGDLEVFAEHLYTEQLQNVMRAAIQAHASRDGRPRVLLTTFPEEEHALGLLMVEALLASEGCQCLSLGIQTPIDDIREATRAGGVDTIALSFSAAYPARQAIEGLRTLRGMLPEAVQIWAGGSGVSAKSRQLPGIRVVGSINEVLDCIREWRAAHDPAH